MDKKYNLNDEETFQFEEAETETTQPFSTANAPTDTTTPFDRIKRQHIVLGFVFIFLVFGSYKLLSGLFHNINKPPAIEKIQKTVSTPHTANGELNTEVKTDSFKQLDHITQGQQDIQSAIQSLGFTVIWHSNRTC